MNPVYQGPGHQSQFRSGTYWACGMPKRYARSKMKQDRLPLLQLLSAGFWVSSVPLLRDGYGCARAVSTSRCTFSRRDRLRRSKLPAGTCRLGSRWPAGRSRRSRPGLSRTFVLVGVLELAPGLAPGPALDRIRRAKNYCCAGFWLCADAGDAVRSVSSIRVPHGSVRKTTAKPSCGTLR
jgi:hypothetical protein